MQLKQIPVDVLLCQLSIGGYFMMLSLKLWPLEGKMLGDLLKSSCNFATVAQFLKLNISATINPVHLKHVPVDVLSCQLSIGGYFMILSLKLWPLEGKM